MLTSKSLLLLVGVKRLLELFNDGVNLGESVFSEFCSRMDSLTLSLKEFVRPLLKLDLLSSSRLLDDRPREILPLRLLPLSSLELDRSIFSPSSSSRSTWKRKKAPIWLVNMTNNTQEKKFTRGNFHFEVHIEKKLIVKKITWSKRDLNLLSLGTLDL